MNLAPIIPDPNPADPAWAAELKLDGFRGLADTINGRVLSKNLNPLKRFRHLLDSLPLGCVFDGEICVLDREGKPDFNALLFRRGEPVYVAFDLLFYEGEDVRGLALKERRAILDQVASRYQLQKSELFIGCGKSLFDTVCRMDLEGVIYKRLKDHYAPTVQWFKMPNPAYSQKERRGELFERRYG